MKTVLFSSNLGDVNADLAFQNNYAAVVDPGVNDDSRAGYQVGSVWINNDDGTAWICVDATIGAASWDQIGSAGEAAGQVTAPAAATPTGTGGAAGLTGGAGGTTSGNGGPANVTGGAATAGNGAGGSVVLTGGAKNGTGVAGGVRVEGLLSQPQGAPSAKTTSGALTAADVLAGIITVTQGGGANSNQQMPSGTALQAALPADFAVDDSFDFSVINLGGASETATLTANTDVTIVGRAIVDVAAATASGSGRFRVRKTGDHVFVVYRIA